VKKVLIIVVTIVAVVALGNVLLVSAQGGQPPVSQNGTCPMSGYTCPFSGTMPYGGPGGMMGGGMMGGRGMMPMHGAMMGAAGGAGANGLHEQVWTAVAEELGMTYDELLQATQNGQTVAQLAEEQGVTLDELKDAAQEAHQAALADLVEQGVLTQEQADWMADHLDDMPMFNFGQGFGPGMMNGRGMMRGGFPGGMMRGGRGYQQPAGPQG
jgi:hypothetical protein